MWFDLPKYFSEKLVDEKHRRYPLKDVLRKAVRKIFTTSYKFFEASDL